MFKEYDVVNERLADRDSNVRDATEEEIIALIESKVDLTGVPTMLDETTFMLYKVYKGVKYSIDTMMDMRAKGLIPSIKVFNKV